MLTIKKIVRCNKGRINIPKDIMLEMKKIPAGYTMFFYPRTGEILLRPVPEGE